MKVAARSPSRRLRDDHACLAPIPRRDVHLAADDRLHARSRHGLVELDGTNSLLPWSVIATGRHAETFTRGISSAILLTSSSEYCVWSEDARNPSAHPSALAPDRRRGACPARRGRGRVRWGSPGTIAQRETAALRAACGHRAATALFTRQRHSTLHRPTDFNCGLLYVPSPVTGHRVRPQAPSDIHSRSLPFNGRRRLRADMSYTHAIHAFHFVDDARLDMRASSSSWQARSSPRSCRRRISTTRIASTCS